MTREEMLRNLGNVYELYKDRPVHTFEINIASMIRDVISFINENTIEPIDKPTAHWKDGKGTSLEWRPYRSEEGTGADTKEE